METYSKELMIRKRLLASFFALAFGAIACFAENPSDSFYQAIRNNDLSTLRTLLKTSDVSLKDQKETTPLMYAAAFGSLDAMKILVEAGADVNATNALAVSPLLWCAGDLEKVRLLVSKGADVNARSKQGQTPLLIAASHDGASEIVKLLISKGADVSARGFMNTTALLSATYANDMAIVKLLLQKGVDVNAKDATGETALMNAAGYGNVEVTRMLLAKGADVNAVSVAEGQQMKNGLLALASLTPLLLAVAYGGPDEVKILLDAGANVNAVDVRGMTPLMLAIGTDRADARVVKLLLARGADTAIKSKNGETAADWAKKFSCPQILAALGIDKVRAFAAPAIVATDDHKLPTAREAVEKSLPMLQRAGASFLKEGGCISCHNQNLTAMAVSLARTNKLAVDDAAAAMQSKTVRLQWASFEPLILQRVDPPGAMDTLMYSVLHLAVEGGAPDHTVDAIIHNIAGEQRTAGNWTMGGVARPPMEDGDFSRTAICLRSLAVYPLPGRKTEFDQRIQRAAAWLKASVPRTTEDRSMQLLGLKWANVDRRDLDERLKKLISLQRADGGWAQTPDLTSDAYATGQVLYTIHELGVAASNQAYRQGVAYLLRTQLADGSWHVASRAPKFQPYFQGGFPHDHDQWISSSATAWATMALIPAVAGPTVADAAERLK
jgi:ankyrin repeat protein